MPATRRRRRARPQPPTKTGGAQPDRTPRAPADVDALTDAAEFMLLHAMGREAMSRQLGKVWTKRQMDAARAEGRAIEVPPEPLPLGTTDDYIRRVKDRWEANPLPDRLQSRDRARRRILGQILDRASKDDHDGVAKRESILVKIEGTEVPKTLEISGPGGAPVAFRGADEILPMLEKLAGKKD